MRSAARLMLWTHNIKYDSNQMEIAGFHDLLELLEGTVPTG